MNTTATQTKNNNKKTVAAAAGTFTAASIADIKGAKGMANFIKELTATFENIKQVLERDLAQPAAIVNENDEGYALCRNSTFQFKAHMASVAHRTFIHHITRCLPSELVSAQYDVTESLHQLQNLLKMIVNNKQQHKMTIKQIKQIHSAKVIQGHHDENTVLLLDQLIETTKGNHRTVARKILEQAKFVMRLAKSRVLAYKNAADTTIGKIIHYADRCRAFVKRCSDKALIEKCASMWWFDTQKDAMDHSDYRISVVDVDAKDDESDLDALLKNPLPSRYTSFSELTPESAANLGNIRIFVHSCPTTRENPDSMIVTVYDLDQELAETILTDEAVRSFRREKYAMWKQKNNSNAVRTETLSRGMELCAIIDE
jgi:hypothetical protein